MGALALLSGVVSAQVRVWSAGEAGQLVVFEVEETSWRSYREVTGRIPPCRTHRGLEVRGDDLPVVCVTWCDAVRFANLRSRQEGRPLAYEGVDGCEATGGASVLMVPGSAGWRLPTEAEWLRTATALGQHTAYAGTDWPELACPAANGADEVTVLRLGWDEVALPCDDGFAGPRPAHLGQPNAAGLRNLSGNVEEWVFDRALPGQTPRVRRGGSWADGLVDLRLDLRRSAEPTSRSPRVGFRLVRTWEEEEPIGALSSHTP